MTDAKVNKSQGILIDFIKTSSVSIIVLFFLRKWSDY